MTEDYKDKQTGSNITFPTVGTQNCIVTHVGLFDESYQGKNWLGRFYRRLRKFERGRLIGFWRVEE